MKDKLKILAISGSTRTNSTNENILKLFSKLYTDVAEIEIFKKLDTLPHFNPDIATEEEPVSVKDFLKKIQNADGVFICTPEYVFSLPGSLKNALEWTVSSTVFSDKPVGFIIASGLGEKAFESLDLIMATLVQQQIPDSNKLLLQGGRSKIDVNGAVRDEQTLIFLKNVFSSFLKSVRKE